MGTKCPKINEIQARETCSTPLTLRTRSIPIGEENAGVSSYFNL